ncbi:GCN5-related N-acetyltransferase [Pseudopedobacter saltans DSM 12145]|uniref:GCN5-related N-acetyltransferase n=1 Tax=Pseudopedobacter saltans (strain ATCC 51119 / DSM 12145 / JCM 21818 / CCUG 39354 / LMG 10337 / NBRC 100064 / NCIMB 13643) TaxID=762903 RepID=F0S9N9_PSESL|nr:GNAT family N-acetyltransferase [Pseudopedobacter saltans]ADY51395.1 GCN5-related N-acetyltransferase [Pseudopedobacter saltans DSM 12145]
MGNLIYLRPLVPEDAKISYQWRNDPRIWEFTEFKPTSIITEEIETKWLEAKLKKANDQRFAICLSDTNQYIGNIQIIDIESNKGEFHLFIGEKQFWRKGIGMNAAKLILQYGFFDMKLEMIFLFVHKNNTAALSIYDKLGFITVHKRHNQFKMVLTKSMYLLENKFSEDRMTDNEAIS